MTGYVNNLHEGGHEGAGTDHTLATQQLQDPVSTEGESRNFTLLDPFP